jgi:heme-degrading monooxygenase HmoA
MANNVYRLNLPEHPLATIFVNGIIARDFRGWFWMWKSSVWMRDVTANSPGCKQVKTALCSVREFLMVSYWDSPESLHNFFKGESHRQMMQFVAQNPESLCLYNETYQPDRTGKYIHEPHGMAKIYDRAE